MGGLLRVMHLFMRYVFIYLFILRTQRKVGTGIFFWLQISFFLFSNRWNSDEAFYDILQNLFVYNNKYILKMVYLISYDYLNVSYGDINTYITVMD